MLTGQNHIIVLLVTSIHPMNENGSDFLGIIRFPDRLIEDALFERERLIASWCNRGGRLDLDHHKTAVGLILDLHIPREIPVTVLDRPAHRRARTTSEFSNLLLGCFPRSAVSGVDLFSCAG